MTAGFEVFVQLVMAAMTTAPSSRSNFWLPATTGVVAPLPADLSSSVTLAPAALSAMRSCGRFGPEMLGYTVPMSSVLR
jgi:hypothetical protein